MHSGYFFFSIICRLLIFFVANLLGYDKNLNEIINIPNIKALCLMVSDKIFFMFSLYKLMLNIWPLGCGNFLPQGHNLNKHGRVLIGDATYQIPKVYALWYQRRRFFHGFPI